MLWLAIAIGIHPAQAEEVEPLIQGWLDSVVKITTGPSLCAGVMLERPGLVATAYHCVASGRRSRVERRNGDSAVGRILATDPDNDLALVEIDAFEDWQGLAIRSDSPSVGEQVWALGHPLGFNADMNPSLEGLLYFSVSSGIVSAVGPKLVQVDAPLNPGNSGGPILDDKGQIVGIASRKLRGEGLSFVAPAQMLTPMQAEAGSFRRLGGQYGVVLGALLPWDIRNIPSVELGFRMAVRDTLVLSALVARPLGANWEALARGEVSWVSWEFSGALRGRVGRGRWSTALDAGVVALVLESRQAHIEDGRLVSVPGQSDLEVGALLDLHFGGTTYGVRIVPNADGTFGKYVVFSTALGGVMGTF